MSPKHFGSVCIILHTANLYVLASHLNIQALQLICSIYPPSTLVSNQSYRIGSSGLKERKFLTNFLVVLFFQCFGIHVTWKSMPWSDSLPHTQASICISYQQEQFTSVYIIPLGKNTTKKTCLTIDLCAASPDESVGVLCVRQLKDRCSKNSNLKMPQEGFKLHFPVHAKG